MKEAGKIYVLGTGAVGMALAAHLACEGRIVVAVRTSRKKTRAQVVTISVRDGVDAGFTARVQMRSLATLTNFGGLVVVTAKSHANPAIASALRAKGFTGRLVILQNGLGVETPFVRARFARICRCVLYMTAQTMAEHEVTFRAIASSPIGLVNGSAADLQDCVAELTTPGFPFHPEPDLPREVWKKTIVNAVFNSICPLLDVDNGVFFRDQTAAGLAREVVGECIVLAKSRGLSLTEAELMERIMSISRGSNGVSISTLQDIRNGRETEIASLNLELARIASSGQPPITLSKTEFLGKMILAKAGIRQGNQVRNTM